MIVDGRLEPVIPKLWVAKKFLLCRANCQNFPFQTVKIFLCKLSKFSFSNCQNFPFQLSKFSFPNCQNFPFQTVKIFLFRLYEKNYLLCRGSKSLGNTAKNGWNFEFDIFNISIELIVMIPFNYPLHLIKPTRLIKYDFPKIINSCSWPISIRNFFPSTLSITFKEKPKLNKVKFRIH